MAQLPHRPQEERPEKSIEAALDDVILMSSGAFERANQIVEERKKEIDLMLKKVNEESETATERLKHVRTREGILRRKEEELKALEAKKKEIEDRMGYLEKKEDELRAMETRLEHLDDEISAEKERIEKEMEEKDRRIASLEAEGSRLKQETARLSITLKEKEKDAARARTEDNDVTAALRQRISALEAETEEKRKVRIGRDLEVMNLQETVKEAEKKVKEKDTRIDALEKERESLRGEIASLQDRMETITRWSESISSKLKSAETTIPALANARMVLEQRVSSLEGNLKSRDARLTELQTMQNALPLLQRAKSTLEDRVNQLEGELKDREKWVREANALKQKITSLTSEKEILEHRTQSLDSENISLKQEMLLLRKTIASSHEQVERERGASMQTIKERDGLRAELDAVMKGRNDIETRTSTLTTRIETLQHDVELARRIVTDKDTEISSINAKAKTLENQNEALRNSLKQITKERDDLLSEIDALYHKQDSTVAEIDQAKGAMETGRKQVLELQNQLGQEKSRAMRAEEELSSMQKALQKIKDDRDRERGSREEIIKLREKEIDGLRKEIDALMRSGDQLKAKEKASIEAEGLKARIVSLDAECSSLRKTNAELQAIFNKAPSVDASSPQFADLKKREMYLTSELERYKNDAVMRNEELVRLKDEANSLRKRATELLDASKIQVEERRKFQEENENLRKRFDDEHELRLKTENAMKRAVSDLNALQEESTEVGQFKSLIEVERQRLNAKEKELADLEIAFAKQTREVQREREGMERERATLKEKSEGLKKKEQDLQEFVTETFLVESKGDKKKGKASQKAMEAKLMAAFDLVGTEKGSKEKSKGEPSGAQIEEMQEYVSKVIFEYEKKLDSMSEQSESMRRELDEKRRENSRLKGMLQEFVSPQSKGG